MRSRIQSSYSLQAPFVVLICGFRKSNPYKTNSSPCFRQAWATTTRVMRSLRWTIHRRSLGRTVPQPCKRTRASVWAVPRILLRHSDKHVEYCAGAQARHSASRGDCFMCLVFLVHGVQLGRAWCSTRQIFSPKPQASVRGVYRHVVSKIPVMITTAESYHVKKHSRQLSCGLHTPP